MCLTCCRLMPNRRRFVSLALASTATVASAGRYSALAANHTTSITANEAIERLKAGNEKYVNAPQLCAVDLSRQREQVAKAQTPWATILTCSDGRVLPELIFGGVGLGDLFIARNSGNVIDKNIMRKSMTSQIT